MPRKANADTAKKTGNTAKKTGNTAKKTGSAAQKKQVSSLRKLKLLFTVVNRSKTLFFEDLLEQFEVNVQTVVYGKGTANSQLRDLLGIIEAEKSLIISYVREDRVKEIMDTLDEKFQTVKNGKGIAFTVPFDSMIGVATYQLLSNDKTVRVGEKKQ